MRSRHQHQLQHFIDAQESCYQQVCQELTQGKKQSHWIWFIFPQLQGLGLSDMAQKYAIESLEHAQAYWQDKTLHTRYITCCDLLLSHKGRTIHQIMGYPDDVKLHSSVTLFLQIAPDNPVLRQVLAQFYHNQLDEKTLELLA